MIDIHQDEGPDPKSYFTHSLLPSYIDPQNVSTKKKPFSLFNAQHFSHTLDVILPEEIYEIIRAQLEDESGVARSQYARVHMKLGELLQGDFFTEYIKKGNIMMLSEGRPLIDNVFSLYEGVLRLELDRPTYERCGLQGNPIEDGGKKHQKSRWVVEFDLRATSMLHGKKLFGRLEWACENVLNQSLTWLFYNFSLTSSESLSAGKEPISIHHPTIHPIMPVATRLDNVLLPIISLADLPNIYDQDTSLSLLEYLHLLSLGSPRICKGDRVDSFLSRYEIPEFGHGLAPKNMVRIRWRGFIPPRFARELFLSARKDGLKIAKEEQDGEGGTANQEDHRWIALTANAFEGFGGGWSVVQFAGRETLSWEYD
ncbi:hypothetical protein K504DRAFT_437416 [Pleomassaria siparia CBS 279.74]|uniref:Uncharacterized protein n=1 Tax=Pleomassaria siparia CBS 279.74 TaxID=1314801 RepID=A0A6G1K1A8_9PLEO|nr:hypothetical protein K504DRAFT_437416 [Pleomassaria siparia CBS 279.74]